MERKATNAGQAVAWITGASRGIGRAIALAFGRAGWRVAVQCRERRDEAERVAEGIRRTGGEAGTYHADVRDVGQMDKVAAAVFARWQRLDVVICNAGLGTSRLIARTNAELWDAVVATNLTGVFHTLRAAGATMCASGGGHIVVVGSLAGFQGQPGQAAYAAGKAGLLGLVRSAAREWGGSNVRVNLVLPGWHRTELSDEAMPEEPAVDHLLGRTPNLDEVARTIVHLAACRDVSGQVWNLDSRIG